MTYSKSDIAEIVVAVIEVLESRRPNRTRQAVKPKASVARRAKASRKASTANLPPKEERKVVFEVALVEAALAAGYKDAKPNTNVFVYDKWLAKGRKVSKGQKAFRVNGVPMFHLSQTEALAA